MKLVTYSDRISYITPDESLICSSIGIVRGDNYSILIDIGASKPQLGILKDGLANGLIKNNIQDVVITHFHPDHTSNLSELENIKTICSKNTSRYIKADLIIDKQTDLDLKNTSVKIIPLPSVHAKGSLAIYVEEDKAMFIGDALCMKEKDYKPFTNKDITLNMINTLRSYPIQKYFLGHEDGTISTSQINAYLDQIYLECKQSKSTDVFLSDKIKNCLY